MITVATQDALPQDSPAHESTITRRPVLSIRRKPPPYYHPSEFESDIDKETFGSHWLLSYEILDGESTSGKRPTSLPLVIPGSQSISHDHHHQYAQRSGVPPQRQRAQTIAHPTSPTFQLPKQTWQNLQFKSLQPLQLAGMSPLRTNFRATDFATLSSHIEEGNRRLAAHLAEFGAISDTFKTVELPPPQDRVRKKLKKPKTPTSFQRSRIARSLSNGQSSRPTANPDTIFDTHDTRHQFSAVSIATHEATDYSSFDDNKAEKFTSTLHEGPSTLSAASNSSDESEGHHHPEALATKSDFFYRPGPQPLYEERIPTLEEIECAARLEVISEDGDRVSFGSLWESQRTIVLFIRHFLCPWCQDYLFSLSTSVSYSVLEQAGIRLVIISNGSYKMISSYRKIFRTPFTVYTDPTLQVYKALGMTTWTAWPSDLGPRGDYVRHGTVMGLSHVLANAMKVKMPLWNSPGAISQNGGEFIFGPGMNCSFAHRMPYPRTHTCIMKVITMTGVDMYTPLAEAKSLGRSFLGMTAEEEENWMTARKVELAEMRNRKTARRSGHKRWCNDPKACKEPLEAVQEDSDEDFDYDDEDLIHDAGRLIEQLIPDAASLCHDDFPEFDIVDSEHFSSDSEAGKMIPGVGYGWYFTESDVGSSGTDTTSTDSS